MITCACLTEYVWGHRCVHMYVGTQVLLNCEMMWLQTLWVFKDDFELLILYHSSTRYRHVLQC